jgi:hypothetical protein
MNMDQNSADYSELRRVWQLIPEYKSLPELQLIKPVVNPPGRH